MQTTLKTAVPQLRGTAYATKIPTEARRAGVGLGASELLSVLREERSRRAGGAVVPSVARLARLLGCSERQVQRRAAELGRAGLLWRFYRGGRGRRSLWYVQRPAAVLAGFSCLDPWSADPAKGDENDTLKGAHSLDLEKEILERTEGAAEPGEHEPSEPSSGAAPAELQRADASKDDPHPSVPAPRAGKGEPVPLGTLQLVWGVWLRVWAAKRGGRYERCERDGSVALAFARHVQGRRDGARELSWIFARYLRQHGDQLPPLWLAPVPRQRVRVRVPERWCAKSLRCLERAPGAREPAPSMFRRAAPAAVAPATLPADAAAELRRLFGGSWGSQG